MAVFATVVAIRVTFANPRIELKLASLIVAGGVLWLIVSALEVSTTEISTKLLFNEVHYVGLMMIPTPWLVLAMIVSGYERMVTRKTAIALSIVPLITQLLIFTNGYHGLLWNSVGVDAVNPLLPLNFSYSLGYWLLVVGYQYALLLVGSVIFVNRIMLSRRLYRLQAFPVALVLAVPWAADALSLYNRSWFGYVAPTPVSLTVAAAILMWRLVYLPALDVVPVAHEMIIDNMSDSVIVLDWERRVVELNPSAQALVGHTLQEVVGRTFENAWNGWPSLKKALDSGTREVSFGKADEQQTYELQTSALARFGRTDDINTLIILRNITDRKAMEQKLRIYSEHLEDLVAERTKELREAERMAAIGETAAMVGHDLRNPLQGISGAIYVLKKNLRSTMSQQTKEMVQIIEDSVQHSNRIVSDLLDYSREPKPKLEETNLNQLVKESVTSVKIPENIRVKFTVGEQPITVDFEMMRRVFLNIVINAVDAMPSGGELTIESRESNGNLQIFFTDTGTGIPDEAMAKLWKPLNTTKAKGSGLGLAICKRIVEAHNGTISLKTAHGKGTTIAITIPTNKMSEGMDLANPDQIAA